MIPLQGSSLTIDVGLALLLTGIGVGLSILALAWTIATKLSEVSTKLNGLNEVQKLTAQLEMIDASEAATIPEDISDIKDDVDEVTESVRQVDSMVTSVNTIERSVTNIDFEGIERAVDKMADGGLPTGNSVEYTLEQAGIDVVISLSSIDADSTEVNFRFAENVGARKLLESLVGDEELTAFEQSLFDSEPNVYPLSPRQLEAEVPSSEMDRIVEWVKYFVDSIDDTYVEIHESKDEFDSLLEENLDG